MPSVDDRIVAMVFENAKFEAAVAQTLATLSKLDTTLKNIGAVNGLNNIEAAANKVQLAQPLSALDKLKAKLGLAGSGAAQGFADIDAAGNKVTLQGPTTALERLRTRLFGIGNGAAQGFSDIESAGNKLTLASPFRALSNFSQRLFGIGKGSAQGFADVEQSGNKLTLEGPSLAVDKFQSKLAGLSSGDTFAEIENAADQVTLGGLTGAIEHASRKFGALRIAGITAMATIVSKATSSGIKFIKAFTTDPLKEGFEGYQKQIDATQVVMSNLGLKGTAGLKKVTDQLDVLKHYAQQTVYNFSDMAKNVGTFTAAGVGLKDSTAAIKGIANASALAGGDAARAAPAMYQLSQALANNKFGVQDYTSVVTAGFGGKAFQQSLLYTAQAMGKVGKDAIKAVGPMKNLQIEGKSFREAIMSKPGEKPLIDGAVLSKALATFTGDLSVAQLKAQGYTDQAAKTLHAQGIAAKQAASQIKTFDQLQAALKEEVAGAYANVFKALVGDLFQARTVFTKVHTVIENDLTNPINNFAKVVDEANKKFDFRDNIIKGLKNISAAFKTYVKPVQDAFREIFPKQTAKGLGDFAKNFKSFTATLKLGGDKADALKKTFAGVFAVFHIGVTLIKDVIKVVGKLFGVVGHGSGGFLNLTGSIGEFLVSLDKAISGGEDFGGLLGKLGGALKLPIEGFKFLAGIVKDLFSGAHTGAGEKLAEVLHKLGINVGPLKKAFAVIKKVFEGIAQTLVNTYTALQPILDGIGNLFSDFGRIAGHALRNLDLEQVLGVLQAALTGGIFVAIKKGFTQVGEALGPKSPLGQVHETVSILTGSLKAMQQNIQARTLLTIAGAVLVLAGGLFLLSTIPAQKLSGALSAVAVGLGELAGVLAILARSVGGGGGGGGEGKFGKVFGALSGAINTAKLPIIALALVLLSGALILLAVAVKQFSQLSFEELGKGLIGVGGSLAAIAEATKLIEGRKIIAAAAVIIPLAIGLGLLATAVKLFSSIDLASLGKGLLGMAVALDILIVGMNNAGAVAKKIGPSILLVGPALIGIAFALNTIVPAIVLLGGLRLDALAKGVGGIALSLGILGAGLQALGAATKTIGPSVLLVGPALAAIAFALDLLVPALISLGSVSIKTLAKGLIALAFALDIMGIAMTAIGRVAAKVGPQVLLVGPSMLAMAAALAVLVPLVILLGAVPILNIVKGLVAMAAILGTLALVGQFAAEPLVLLGAALGTLALAGTIAAAGVYLFAKALALLTGEGPKGIAIMTTAITAFILLLPKIAIDFAKGMLSLVTAIADVAPKIALQLGIIIDSLLDTIIKAAPKLATAAIALIGAFLKVINEKAKPIIDAGINLIANFLSGIAKNIGRVTTSAAQIIVRFLKALGDKAPDIAAGGARVVIKFLSGIASKLPDMVTSASNVAVKFLEGIAKNAKKFVAAGVKAIVSFLGAIADNLKKVIDAGARIIIKFVEGVGNKVGAITTAATNTIIKFVEAVTNKENTQRLVNAGLKGIIHFLQGLAAGLRQDDNLKQVIDAAVDVGVALVEGIAKGLAGLPKVLASKMLSPVKGAVNKVKGVLHINSPSKVFIAIGESIVEGMGDGLAHMSKALDDGIGNPIRKIIAENHDGKKFGRFLAGDFTKGLAAGASADDIRGAFDALKGKVKDEQAKFKEDIGKDQSKLQSLLGEEKQDPAKIKALFETIRAKKELLAASKKASSDLLKGTSAEEQALLNLGETYDKITAKIEEVKKFIEDTAAKYDTLPDFDTGLQAALDDADLTFAEREQKRRDAEKEAQKRANIDQVALYEKALQAKIDATEKYNATLQKLRDLGLDDQTFQKLLDEGPQDQQFADQLVKGGADAVKKLNDLDAKLKQDADALAETAAEKLYGAGVNVAQGIVKGLQDQADFLAAIMDGIGQHLVDTIKKKLGIKSPSRVFAEIGKFTGQGLAGGLKGSSALVATAAGGLGDDAAAAMRDSLSQIGDAVTGQIDIDPTITPVLDLTQVQKDASKLSDLTNVVPITAAASYGQATAISDAVEAAQAAQAAQPTAEVKQFNFTQTNTSPEALSNVEIYRQTNNQLSTIKEALGL